MMIVWNDSCVSCNPEQNEVKCRSYNQTEYSQKAAAYSSTAPVEFFLRFTINIIFKIQ